MPQRCGRRPFAVSGGSSAANCVMSIQSCRGTYDVERRGSDEEIIADSIVTGIVWQDDFH